MHSQVLLSTMHVQVCTLDRCCEHQRTHLLHPRYRMCIFDIYKKKRRENGTNVTSFRAWPLWPATWVGYELGGSAPHQCRWAGCCLFAVLSWLCVGCSGFGRFFHWPLVSSWTVNLIILGLGFLRARLLQLSCTAVFPPIFLPLRKGPLWSCASSKLFWVMLGRGDGGVLVLQDVGTMKSLHWRCEMWVDCVERKRSAQLLRYLKSKIDLSA